MSVVALPDASSVISQPHLAHVTPGRVRLSVPALTNSPAAQRLLETSLRREPGVHSVQANPTTGSVVIRYASGQTDPQVLLRAAERLEPNVARTDPQSPPRPDPPVVQEGRARQRRARIAVRGLDRDPDLARTVVERLQRLPGVRATPSTLTGRVLVEYDSHFSDIQDLLSEVADVELPDTVGEDRPAHPLDPAPLWQSAARVGGAGLGLAVIGGQRLTGSEQPLVSGQTSTIVSAGIHIAQAFPPVRSGLNRLVGRNAAHLLLSLPDILVSSLTGSPLSLATTFLSALRLLTEVVPRRAAFRAYMERLSGAEGAVAGDEARVEAGERTPLAATVMEGFGTGIGRDGLPFTVCPGSHVPPGARLYGGPFTVNLIGGKAFLPPQRPAPPKPSLDSRYQKAVSLLSLAYAAVVGVVTRSPSRFFESLLLVNPRAAAIGREAADTGASARVLRAGVTVVGTRPERRFVLPDLLLLDGPRLLTNGMELTGALPFSEECEGADLIPLAAGVAAAAGLPWGASFPAVGAVAAGEGSFDGMMATAQIGGVGYALRPARDQDNPQVEAVRRRGEYALTLEREGMEPPLGLLILRPKLADGVAELVRVCRTRGIPVRVLGGGDRAAIWNIARRAGVPLLEQENALETVQAAQAQGARVVLVSDNADAAEAFAACDLSIGLTAGRSGRFPARADLLAPDLVAVAAIMEASARRNLAVRDAIGFSAISNVAGVIWGLSGRPGLERATRAVYLAALASLGAGWLRLRGGERPRVSLARLSDPHPERWGARTPQQALAALKSVPEGLTTTQAIQRRRHTPPTGRRNALFSGIMEQLRSPLTGILVAGAGLSLFLGHPLDFGLILGTVAINVAVGVYQEHQAGRAADALARMGNTTVTVLRDGRPVNLPAPLIVPGDVLVLASGDRVAADARLLEANGLEVDEAALTGESLPVSKSPDAATDAARVLLEGSDVTVGTARAVVFAVGPQTRMGVTAAALALDGENESPLGRRLGLLLRQFLPLAAIGGAAVFAGGALRGQPLLPQLGVAATIALAAVPEGLPLLAGMGEASVARRLAGRKALVRRLSAVEALGRVDIACTDKTGTLTQGRLALSLVAAPDAEAELPAEGEADLPSDLRHVLLTAALASPHPDAADASSHPTDVAVVQGAQRAGLGHALRAARDAEAPFDPARAFHAARVGARLCVKGSPEAVASRCAGGDTQRDALLAQAHTLAERGLRVLMVAEGRAEASPENPCDLSPLGFIGIRDPLRPGVPAAVRRCREAGVRVIMITGDHPATARAIAAAAGLLGNGEEVLTSAEIAGIENGDLAATLERAAVIARATPLDKLRIIESLQAHGHTVAMTGDGVNDAPALRLADVGVAMGQGGTEVARQAADLVLMDDDFSTLVETLVEGRGFWRNMRRALGLLLGGNMGELGLVVGASLLGLAAPLNTRQILAMNLITDALPALSVATQQPEHRDLSTLAREGQAALDAPLRRDVLRRGTATALPSLAAFMLALPMGLPQARTIAFSSVVATQLFQTLAAGRGEAGLTRGVLAAVGSSGALLLLSLTLPPLRDILTLTTPTLPGWGLIGLSASAALLVARSFSLSPASLSLPRLRQSANLLPAPA